MTTVAVIACLAGGCGVGFFMRGDEPSDFFGSVLSGLICGIGVYLVSRLA